MANPLIGKQIMLGITGSIAAYKAAELASHLSQQGAVVNTLLTEAAMQFITPLTFQSVSGQKAYTDADLWGGEGHIVHVNIGHTTDLLIIAPASANTIAKLAHGIADNLLTVTALAATCPLIIAPAMDAGMYQHPATVENVKILQSRGALIIGPAEGHLASGLVGAGRMEDPDGIIAQARFLISRSASLRGKKIIVTAGGTREAIDPVRFLSNRSSGKQGYAIAQAALDMGSDVTLISAPTSLTPPFGCHLITIESAEQMLSSVLDHIPDAHALIMSAAVADFRPAAVSRQKIKKESRLDTLALEPTVDILVKVAEEKKKKGLDLKIVGFAAESDNLKANAIKKMKAKHMDMIVANDISSTRAGFGVDTNEVILIYADGSIEKLPLMPKIDVAEKIVQHLTAWLMEGAS